MSLPTDDSSDTFTSEALALLGTPSPDLEAFIGPRGLLAQLMPGFERRSGQEFMMRAVAGCLELGGCLLVEAGTGIGKSLGYLLPAVLSGRRVVVSTGTLALQNQLLDQTIALLRDRLGLSFTARVLKGRSNYLCLHRWEAMQRQAPASPLEGAQRECLAAWVAETETGDLSEVPDSLIDTPLGAALTASAADCLGASCPQDATCFLMRARRQAQAADIVIVNHHLLVADLLQRAVSAPPLLPAADVLILDEAHRLEAAATTTRARQASLTTARALVAEVVADSAAYEDARERRAVAHAWLAALGRLFACLPDRPGRLRWADVALPVGWDEAASDFAKHQTLFEEVLHRVVAFDARSARWASRLSALGAVVRVFTAPAGSPSDADSVASLERDGRSVTLTLTPLAAGADLGALFTHRFNAVVLTSATLGVAGDLSFTLRQLGLPEITKTLQLNSPFDFQQRACLYVPRALAPPTAEAWPAEVEAELFALVTLTQGRALLLFTSLQRMRAAYAALAERWPFPSYLQGDAPPQVLLERLRTGEGAVVFATATFWEGVDVVGDALSLVVIDRLPFEVPDDPLTSARCAVVRAAGGDAFEDFLLPKAALALKQGVGRLLRHRQDRGIIAVLDVRLVTRPYGATLLGSLPPARRVDRFEEVAAWWGAGGEAAQARSGPAPAAAMAAREV